MALVGRPLLLSFALVILGAASDHISISCAFSAPLKPSAAAPSSASKTIAGPPLSSKPVYESIHGPFGPLLDRMLTVLFRSKLASRLGQDQHPNEIVIADSSRPYHNFMGIIELTHSMNSQYNNRTTVQHLAQDVLVSLFPSFILDRYPKWFAEPFPEFSCRMCAVGVFSILCLICSWNTCVLYFIVSMQLWLLEHG